MIAYPYDINERCVIVRLTEDLASTMNTELFWRRGRKQL